MKTSNHLPIYHLSTQIQQNSPSPEQTPNRAEAVHFLQNVISRARPDPKDVSADNQTAGLYPNHGNSIHLHPSRHVHRKGHTSSSKYRKDVSLLGQLLKSLCYNNARVL